MACGAGPGLRYLAEHAASLKAGDYSPEVLARAKAQTGDLVDLRVFDAQNMPYDDGSFDVVLIFEALYYIPSPQRFFAECRRVLRRGGVLLIATANKDLYDFNPSPHSQEYLGTVELGRELRAAGFEPQLFGYLRVDRTSIRQRLLRPIKKIAVGLDLIPKTMGGKKLLKRIVFGKTIVMPPHVTEGLVAYSSPTPISEQEPDRLHKVIYCSAVAC